MGIGESDYLSGIGGIGENFLIPGHGCIENDFSTGFTIATDGGSMKNTTVFKSKYGLPAHIVLRLEHHHTGVFLRKKAR